MNDSPKSALRALLGNRVVQVLAVIMALLAIYLEGVTAWRTTNEAIITEQKKKAATFDTRKIFKPAAPEASSCERLLEAERTACLQRADDAAQALLHK